MGLPKPPFVLIGRCERTLFIKCACEEVVRMLFRSSLYGCAWLEGA